MEKTVNEAGNEGVSVTEALPKRRYGQWVGNPKGHPEDPSRCIEEISPRGGYIFCQCSRKRGHGPNGEYCKQHGRLAKP